MCRMAVRSVGGHYDIAPDTMSAHCVVALSFGYRLTRAGVREPGPCNEYLATLTLATSNGRPIVAQTEIDQAIRSLRRGMGADYVIDSARNPEQYLDTREFAVQVRSIMDRYGWTTAVLIGHPHHLPRAQAVFTAFGINTVTPRGQRPIWDRRSSQLWTRSPLIWTIRELSALWFYNRRGWISTPSIPRTFSASRVGPDRTSDAQLRPAATEGM
jgi:uncharacterized SAM-binding protein YcdF (DUF218 family)